MAENLKAGPLHIAVLASGNGSNFSAIVEAIRGGELDAAIDILICNRPDAFVIRRAEEAEVPVKVLPLVPPVSRARRQAYGDELLAALQVYRPELIVMAGWMVILPANFLDGIHVWNARMINLHPALLPNDASEVVTTTAGRAQPAIRGAHAIEEAIRLYHEGRLSVTGVTIHEVTAQVDVGPVILQQEVPIFADDSAETLGRRVQASEHRLLPQAIALLADEIRSGCKNSQSRIDR